MIWLTMDESFVLCLKMMGGLADRENARDGARELRKDQDFPPLPHQYIDQQFLRGGLF